MGKTTLNTPAHLILGAAAFGRPGAPAVTSAAVFGSLAPDLSLYLMAGWSLFVQEVPARTVFSERYFSDDWQRIFAIDNSFVLWGLLLAVALWLRSGPAIALTGATLLHRERRSLRRLPAQLLEPAIALTGAALLHLALDFPLHHDDARRHFWPLSNWVFQSPVSYWDRNHYGAIVEPVEIALSLAACIWLWLRHRHWAARALVVAAALSQLAPGIMWVLMTA